MRLEVELLRDVFEKSKNIQPEPFEVAPAELVSHLP